MSPERAFIFQIAVGNTLLKLRHCMDGKLWIEIIKRRHYQHGNNHRLDYHDESDAADFRKQANETFCPVKFAQVSTEYRQLAVQRHSFGKHQDQSTHCSGQDGHLQFYRPHTTSLAASYNFLDRAILAAVILHR